MSFTTTALGNFADQMESVGSILTLAGLQLYDPVLKKTAAEVALTLVPPVLTIQFMLIGVKIAMKANFLEHFVQFTTTVILAFILITLQWPQKMILAFQDKVTEGCKLWAGEILSKKDGDGTGNVVLSWYNWLGAPPDRDMRPPEQWKKAVNGDPSNKMGLPNILYLFKYGGSKGDAYFLGLDKVTAVIQDVKTALGYPDPDAQSWTEWPVDYNGNNRIRAQEAVSMAVQRLDVVGIFSVASQVFTKTIDGDIGHILRTLLELIVQGIMLLLIAPMFLGQIMMIATAKATIYLLAPVTKLAMVIGAQYALYLTLGLGLCLMPLIFFSQMNQMWFGYIKFCISLALIPGFYYIFSAIGFYVVSDIYTYVIDPVKGIGLAALIKDIILETVFTVSMELFPWLDGSLILFMMGVIVFAASLAIYNAGVTLIAALAAGGISFASLAPVFAKGWADAFAVDGLSEQIVKIFNAAQTSVSSSMGQAVSQGTSMLGSASASGMMKAAGG